MGKYIKLADRGPDWIAAHSGQHKSLPYRKEKYEHPEHEIYSDELIDLLDRWANCPVCSLESIAYIHQILAIVHSTR